MSYGTGRDRSATSSPPSARSRFFRLCRWTPGRKRSSGMPRRIPEHPDVLRAAVPAGPRAHTQANRTHECPDCHVGSVPQNRGVTVCQPESRSAVVPMRQASAGASICSSLLRARTST